MPGRVAAILAAALGVAAGAAVAALPGAPTAVVAIPGNARATIHLTPPVSDGGSPITGYTVTAAPGGATASAPAWPIVVTGLANGTSYTFTARATNASGTGPASVASNPVTPSLPAITPAISGAKTFALALDVHGQVYAWGADGRGELGTSRPVSQATPYQIQGIPPMAHIAMEQHVLAVDTTGQVWSWGDACGALGPRESPNPSKPSRVIGMTGVVQVATGTCHSYALKSDGTVVQWSGVADGFQAVPFPPGIVDIAAGVSHILARRNDGSVWSYGSNYYGELGQGHQNPISGAVQVPGLASATAIRAGINTSVALLPNGEIRFWGLRNYPNTSTSPTPLTGLGGNAIAIDLNSSNVAAVRADGTMWWWRMWNPDSGPFQVAGMTGASAVTVSGNNSANFAFGSNGLYGYGSNRYGQLGQGAPGGYVDTPVAVPGFATGTAQVRISTFSGAVLIRKTDGSVWFLGENRAGQRGDGLVIGSSVPLAVPLPATIKAIAAGDNQFGIALDTTGQVWGWGTNAMYNDPANGDPLPLRQPTPLTGMTNVAKIAAGGAVAFVKNDGTPWIAGNYAVAPAGAPTVRPVPGLANVVDVASSYGAVFYLRNDGKVFAAGSNSFGELGDGTNTWRVTLAEVTGITGFVTKIIAAYSRVCALTNAGAVWCWGQHTVGPGSNVPQQVAGLGTVVDLAISSYGSLAKLANGQLYAWGSSWLGPNVGVYVGTPFLVPFHDTPQALSYGTGTGFLIGATGLVYGFGGSSTSQEWGTVGDGTYVLRTSPVPLMAHAGSGSLDGNNWFLDLQPATPETIPATLVPRALATAARYGGTKDLALDGSVKYKSADFGKRVNNYVVAVVPVAFFNQVKSAVGRSDLGKLQEKAAKNGGFVLAQLTPAGWADVNGQLIAYSSGTANAAGGASNILNGINASLIPGARFCVGYGESAQSMLSAGALREVLLLEGTAATVSGVPCVISGVYVDGPPASFAGTPVTFNASVVGLSPTGGVQFRDGFASLGSFALTPANEAVARASVTTSSLAIGTHSIGASYGGDSQNAATSTAIPVGHVVTAAASTSVTDLSGPASALSGAEVAFSSVVNGNAPTGTVQFRDGASNLGAPLPLVGGVAILRTSALGVGSHSISAAYSGDGNNAASTSPALSHVVAHAIGTQVALTLSTTSPKIGTSVALTATVSGSSPTGTVQFLNGAAVIHATALAGGQAVFTTTGLFPGTHMLTARYLGDGSNPQATSPPLVLEVAMAIDPAAATADTDGDGIPNSAEEALALNANLRDNDLFTDARLFAMQQYRDFLGREGDAGGVSFWTGQLSTGAQNRAQMVETYFNSAEFQGTGAPVARLYFAYFLRIPDYGGLNHWMGYFRAGNSLNAISDLFAASPEFQLRYGTLTNSQFVSLVYQNVLGRAPDSGGLAHWTGQIDGGMTRGQMMVAFSESPEYRALIDSEIYVTMMYVGMLRRAPDPGGFAFWVGYKDAGNSGLALIDGFLVAPEYRNRFLP